MVAGDTLKLESLQGPHCSSVQPGLRSVCSLHHLTSIWVEPTAPLHFSVNFAGRVPALCYYVSNEGLLGHAGEAAAKVVQWVSFVRSAPNQGCSHLGHHAPQRSGHRVCKGAGEKNSGAAGCSLEDKDFSDGQTCATG